MVLLGLGTSLWIPEASHGSSDGQVRKQGSIWPERPHELPTIPVYALQYRRIHLPCGRSECGEFSAERNLLTK